MRFPFKKYILLSIVFSLFACGKNNARTDGNAGNMISESQEMKQSPEIKFNADSAYAYVARQVEFGPRVPNTKAHKEAGKWLTQELSRHGAKVTEQNMTLTAFDGTKLEAKNIFGQFNPDASDRILLLAHWDCRPWADEDPDPAKRDNPVDGANDGASGVGVLLELARQINTSATKRGIDILFVDAEDWGTEGNEDSWALGTRYFVNNPPMEGYAPYAAILLDMVGGDGATFHREYFSEKSAPEISEQIWATARKLGYGKMFPNKMGSAVTDDHVELIKGGIPAIDIIDYRLGEGFNPRWHTTSDTMEGISKETLQAIGATLSTYLAL